MQQCGERENRHEMTIKGSKNNMEYIRDMIPHLPKKNLTKYLGTISLKNLMIRSKTVLYYICRGETLFFQ